MEVNFKVLLCFIYSSSLSRSSSQFCTAFDLYGAFVNSGYFKHALLKKEEKKRNKRVKLRMEGIIPDYSDVIL